MRADAGGGVNRKYSALWSECGQKFLARPQARYIVANNCKTVRFQLETDSFLRQPNKTPTRAE